jgi:hypothetical protein
MCEVKTDSSVSEGHGFVVSLVVKLVKFLEI